MWLNPKFEYYVIRFVYDQLIEYRHAAGDNYKILNRAVAENFSPKEISYSKVAIALNYLTFNQHGKDLRQHATQAQLDDLTNTQKFYAQAIDSGLITSFDALMREMRKAYNRKWKSITQNA
jgi:hypothetical protein